MTTLINVTRPPKDKVLDFHKDNLELNLSMIAFQCLHRFIFAPTGPQGI